MKRAALFSNHSSGDLLADRRFDYARQAAAEGDFIAARDLARQALERAQAWPVAWRELGRAEAALGDIARARAAFETCLALDPEDRLGARLELARLAAGLPDDPGAPYIRALFDEYAEKFDAHLIDALDYRAPALLAAALLRLTGPAPRFEQALDLGCGTGLMARALLDSPSPGQPPACRIDHLVGVDLSPNMLRQAQACGHYARLIDAEIEAFLIAEPAGHYDLMLAADVFCYVPRLGPVLALMRRRLRRGGWAAFTLQNHAGEGAITGPDLRIQHALPHARDLSEKAGLSIRHIEEKSVRRDRGAPVPGALFLVQAP